MSRRRLFPGILPRVISEDFRFHDFVLPPGTILVQPLLRHMVPNVDNFDPGRFAKNPNLSLAGHEPEFAFFGGKKDGCTVKGKNCSDNRRQNLQTPVIFCIIGGARVCPGARLAQMEAVVYLANLLHCFSWRSAAGPADLPPVVSGLAFVPVFKDLVFEQRRDFENLVSLGRSA